MSGKVLKHTVVVDPAEAEAAADALAAATEEAYERGRVDGIAEGGAVLADVVAQLSAELVATRAQVVADAATKLRSDVETMVALATDLAAWFVEQSVTADPSRAVARVAEAVNELMDDDDGFVVSVSPDLAPAVEASVADGITVRADAELGAADFRVSTPKAVMERVWGDAVADLTPEFASALRGTDGA